MGWAPTQKLLQESFIQQLDALQSLDQLAPDIPELETDEQNWDKGQFENAELLYNHNSTEESDRIHNEYSAYFEKVEDQEYSPCHTA